MSKNKFWNMYFNRDVFGDMDISFELGSPHYGSELEDFLSMWDKDIELLMLNKSMSQKDFKNNPIYRPVEQEFKRNQELIFSGCSQTHGDHISPPLVEDGSHKQIWGFLVAEELSLDAINLGVGAEGVYRIIQRLYAHFRDYGAPKTVLCLFPDLYRFTSPRDPENLLGAKPAGTYAFLEGTFHSRYNAYPLPEYSKKPYKKEEVMSRLVPLFYNIQAISMFEQYCDAAGIKFIWGSWDMNTNIIIEKMKEYNFNHFKYFINLDKDGIDWNDTNCHKGIYDLYPKVYAYGIDKQHMGMHRHAHIAKHFVEKIKNG
jgi:hypothetical protein